MASIIILMFCMLTLLFGSTAAIPTISQVGGKFFTSEGNQWFIKGIAYQLVEDDPLTNADQCNLDATLMKELGANAIRVYHVDPQGDHEECMNAFAAAGIYVMVDLDSFYTYISYDHDPSWTQNKSESYREVMDNFQQYDNTAAFFIGNEVLNTLADSGAAPYVLAAVADLKSYRDAKDYRKIPIGYSATDTTVLRPMLQDYLVCRPNETERVDFYALNSYEWCGQSATYQTSGYDILESMFQNFPVPVFFSEDGCNTLPPRTFDDQAAIFGPEMVGTWSGAVIYEWIEEMNNYGLVSYGQQEAASVNLGSSVVQGFVREGTPTPVQPDFSNLQAQWATITPSGTSSSAYVSDMSLSTPTCPPSSGGWTVNPSAALPTVGASGATPGMPTEVPRGSITVNTNPSSRSSVTYNSAASASSTSSASAQSSSSSATHNGAVGKTNSNPFLISDAGFIGMMTALIVVGAGIVVLL